MPLVPVHGGLDQPVDRTLPLSRRPALAAEAAGWPKVLVEEAELTTLRRIADGTLSPLEGPMVDEEYDRVLAEGHIVRGGRRFAWTIPIALPVHEEEARRLIRGRPAALYDAQGQLAGVLEVESVYAWDKARWIERIYRTRRTDHPGADIALGDARTHLVGGRVSMFPAPYDVRFGQYLLSPLQTRALIATRRWEAALAFQTRNPLHRAHEYALVYGVETLTRRGLFAGVVLQPLVGQLKGDDVDAETRMKTYEVLLRRKLLGQGDVDRALWERVGYELHDVFALVGLDMRMYYGGPSEAVMHAIYRQNHGFSHIVIGRKHADAPYRDGTPIWGDFDAQQIFSALGGELAIEPLPVGYAAYYESIGRVDLTDNHPDEKPVSISGTRIREMLLAGQRPDPRIMRPETADILIEAYRARADG